MSDVAPSDTEEATVPDALIYDEDSGHMPIQGSPEHGEALDSHADALEAIAREVGSLRNRVKSLEDEVSVLKAIKAPEPASDPVPTTQSEAPAVAPLTTETVTDEVPSDVAPGATTGTI